MYSLWDFHVWHTRLCHVNKCIIFNLSNLSLILQLNINDLEKYEFCSQSKITKTSYKLVIKHLNI